MEFGRDRHNKNFSIKKRRTKKFFIVLLVFLCLSTASFLLYDYIKNYKGLPSMKEIYADWSEKNYENVYQKTEVILKKRAYDGEALALRGFASYYIFAEQTDFSLSYSYLNDSILNLRQALYRVSKSQQAKIAYVLGKAYYQKGYYYADLALKYLDMAYNSGEKFKDLSEFRGMAASVLGEPERAIDAFSEALSDNPSDLLFFALAENYIKVSDQQNAKLYLFETIDKTKDTLLELKCRYLLGSLLLDEGKIEDALQEFNTILEKDMTSADAHYGLGVIYELQGDMIKARAEWRRALKFDPLHVKTRAKLNL
ncbi:tetratricopeptide repeat protein [Treponema putidum]|uniref:Tetratricopeptide repeat protein n=1 Tax=Treponema putidum TaxID=221027 RepID=A0AAE9MU90_9SPIR|nr:tetratricopeptide repeat protein [Treponema putidum]